MWKRVASILLALVILGSLETAMAKDIGDYKLIKTKTGYILISQDLTSAKVLIENKMYKIKVDKKR